MVLGNVVQQIVTVGVDGNLPSALALPEALLGDFRWVCTAAGSSSQMAMCDIGAPPWNKIVVVPYPSSSAPKEVGGQRFQRLLDAHGKSPMPLWGRSGPRQRAAPLPRPRHRRRPPPTSAPRPGSREPGGQPDGTGRHWSRPPGIGGGRDQQSTVEGARWVSRAVRQVSIRAAASSAAKGGPWSRSLPPQHEGSPGPRPLPGGGGLGVPRPPGDFPAVFPGVVDGPAGGLGQPMGPADLCRVPPAEIGAGIKAVGVGVPRNRVGSCQGTSFPACRRRKWISSSKGSGTLQGPGRHPPRGCGGRPG